MRDGSETESFELNQELHRDTENGGQEEKLQVAPRENSLMAQQDGKKRSAPENKTIGAVFKDGHFGESHFAEEEAGAPEAARGC